MQENALWRTVQLDGWPAMNAMTVSGMRAVINNAQIQTPRGMQ
jgi:hypothetical protein